MKILLPLIWLLAAVPLFGQATANNSVGTNTFTRAFWSTLGESVDGREGFSLESRDIRESRSGQFQLWVKIKPNNRSAFNTVYDLPSATAFVVQFATVDCSGNSIRLEKTSAYNSNHEKLMAISEKLTPRPVKNKAKRGSVGDAVYERVCIKP